MKEKISIIVPIYNVEKYLRDCFESLLGQTFSEYVIYAVNDGSPDGSQSIIDEYSEKYPQRVIPIHKENGGYGSVLEYAIRNIKTPYFLICDPDDTIESDCLEKLYGLAEKYSSDIVVGGKTLVYETSDFKEYDRSYNYGVTGKIKDNLYEKGQVSFEKIFFIDPSPHAKLYRTDIAKNIKFLRKCNYTDNTLFFLSLLNANKVVYTHDSLANYLINRTGNTMGDTSDRAVGMLYDVFTDILKQAKSFKDINGVFYYRIFTAFQYIEEKRNGRDIHNEKRKELLSLLKGHKNDILFFYGIYSQESGLKRAKSYIKILLW